MSTAAVSETWETIKNKIELLNPEERGKLLAYLFPLSISKDTPDAELEYQEELLRRDDEYTNGKLDTFTTDESLARLCEKMN